MTMSLAVKTAWNETKKPRHFEDPVEVMDVKCPVLAEAILKQPDNCALDVRISKGMVPLYRAPDCSTTTIRRRVAQRVDGVNFGLWLPLTEFEYILSHSRTPDDKALQGHSRYPNYELRFLPDNTQLYKAAFAIYSDPSPAANMVGQGLYRPGQKERLQATTMMASAETRKAMPNLSLQDGRDMQELHAWLKTLEYQVGLRAAAEFDKVALVVACFTHDLQQWFHHHYPENTSPATLAELITAIRQHYITVDFENQSLGTLRQLTQENRSINDYNTAFSDALKDWVDELKPKVQIFMYLQGLSSRSLRSLLISQYREKKLLTLQAVQAEATKSSTMTLGFKSYEELAGNSRQTARRQRERNDAPAKRTGGRHGRGGGKRPANPVRQVEPPKKAKVGVYDLAGAFRRADAKYSNPERRKKAKQWHVIRSGMTQAEFNQLQDSKVCINCNKKGHMFEDCPRPLPPLPDWAQ